MWVRRNGRRLAAAIAAWFFSLTMFGKIAVCVIAMHFALLAALGIQHLASPSLKKRAPLAVRIHQISQEKAIKRVVKKPAPAPAPTPPPVKKKPLVKRAAPAPKPIKAEILREIEESFATLTTSAPAPKTSSKIQLPAHLESATVEMKVENLSSGFYGPLLVETLQTQLQLPEMGDVRAKLTIQAPGRLLFLEILDTKSFKNAEWLKNQLPLLELPCFNDFEITDAKLEFTITFRNVEKI
jgi:hypothetical protein